MRKALNFINYGLLIIALGAIMVVLREYDFGSSTGFAEPKTLAATGFIVLAAFAMGEFFKLLNIPALLGYIVAGIVFGPNFFSALNAWGVIADVPEALFSKDVIADLPIVSVLTVGVIGTMGGGELVLEDIKKNLKTILFCVAIFTLLVVPATIVTVLILADYAPTVLPFLEGLDTNHTYAVALLFGVFGVAMSPAATLAILQETKASGRFTSLALGVVIVADLVLVAGFLLAFAFDQILLSPEGFSTALLIAELPKIGAEFGYAILLGIGTGLVFIAYLRWVGREELFFTVAIIFVATAISRQLHAETLLAFLTAGFIVMNFSKHGHDMIHALEKISLPVFVLYFMTEAAKLDLQAVVGFAILTLVLTAVRGVTLYVGATLGADFAGADPTTRKYLWLTFFSRGGVDLVLAAKVADSAIPWGVEFQAVIMACVVVHILVGPSLLKFALDAVGETANARQRTVEEATAFENVPAVEASALEQSFATGRFEDPELASRVDALRTILVELHRDYIANPLREKAEALDASLVEAAEELGMALDKLQVVLSSDEYDTPQARADAVAAVHIEYLHDIADNIEIWEQINPEIVHHDRIQELIDAVRNREEFGSTYRVERERYLFEAEPGDGIVRRLGKIARRMRRAVLGPGTRSVPLGRLWRYYVELMITRYLARAVAATSTLNERFWADLGNHMRRIDDLFDAVYDAVLEPDKHHTIDRSTEMPRVSEEANHRDDGETHEAASSAAYDSEALRVLALGRTAAIAREAKIDEQLRTLTATAIDRYTVPLREKFARFVRAAEVAGTYELPQWRYRPSTLFDSARRSETRIIDRLRREHTIVTGHRGWIVAEWQLVLFLYWLADYERSIRETLATLVQNPVSGQADVLAALCDSLPDEFVDAWKDMSAVREALEAAGSQSPDSWSQVDWETWLHEDVRPSLERARKNFQRMVGLYDKGFIARRLIEPLERRVGEFSEQIVLLSEHPDQLSADQEVPTLAMRLREWFESEVVRETALRLVEFDERGEAILRTCLASLDEAQQVIEFNLLTAHRDAAQGDHRHAVDAASGGLERAGRMIDEMREAQERRFEQLATWIVDESRQIAERASEPFLEHRQSEIERIMARRGQATLAARGESWAMSAVNSVVGLVRGAYRRWWPVVSEVAADLRGLFVEEELPVRHADIRERLRPQERFAAAIPAIYRRLFTPVPLDIPDFYVPRAGLEQEFVEAATDWVQGRSVTILVHGDRGMGKRSMAQHLLHHSPRLAELRDEVPIHNVALDDDLSSEAELAQRLSAAFDEEMLTLDGLARFVDLLDTQHVIVIENGEKLFSRTKDGLEMSRRFLSTINETSSTILWIVLMGSPAVTYLDTAIGVFDYFTHTLEIGALDEEGVQQMIQRRHRVSGFRANFERERPRIRDWVRRPVGTSEALRDPKAEFFRDLARLSGGNPMMALVYWLDACRVDEVDDHLIWLSTLPDRERELVRALSLTKRLILAALVQHRTLTPAQLGSILRRDENEVQTELEHLQRLGFLRQIVGRQVTAYRLRSYAESVVTVSLRNMNMI